MRRLRGIVQRWDFSGEGVRLWHRTRSADGVWSWSEVLRDAFRFESYSRGAAGTYEDDAATHVARLRAEGVKSVYAHVVRGADAPAAAVEARCSSGVEPSAVYEALERRGLA